MDVITRPLSEPCFDGGMLMGRIVIHNEVNVNF